MAVTLVLLLIVMSGRLAKYLAQASSGDLSADVVLWVILFRVPDFLPLILPLGFFVGILLSYGRLYVDSEMIAMSACGASKRRLLTITLLPALLLSIVVASLTLLGAPASLKKVQSILQDPANSEGLAILQEGKFQLAGDSRRVSYAEQIATDGENIAGLWLFERQEHGAVTVIQADKAAITGRRSHGEQYLSLAQGQVYEGVVGRRDYQLAQFDRYDQRMAEPDRSEEIQLKVDAKSTADLLRSSQRADIAALHWRFSLPIVVLVVAMLAFSLSKTDHRSGRYVKMLPAILIYLLYIVITTGVRDLIESEGYAPLTMWLVHATFFSVALLLLLVDDMRRKMAAMGRLQ